MDPRVNATQNQLNIFMNKYVIPNKSYSRFSDVSNGLGYSIFPIPSSLWNNLYNALELLKTTKEGYLSVSINNKKLRVLSVSTTEKNLTLRVAEPTGTFDVESAEKEFADIFNTDSEIQEEL